MSDSVLFNPQLLARFDANGPRYTSYPTALEFTPAFNEQEWLQAISASPRNDLSLYIHVPFCHSLCYYCGCNKIVTRHSHKADEYLDALIREIRHRGRVMGRFRVRQIHLGGGTPSFLSIAQMQRLLSALDTEFALADDIEMSIEVDPRRLPEDYIGDLARLGFNRLSIGVQDTNTDVQIAINRVQDTALIASIVQQARAAGYHSINLDLIYGLPMQSETGFAKTLQDVLTINPDRVSLFSYAHLPARFAAQRKIKDSWLPNASTKLALMGQAITTLTAAGYEFIGMDHFAKPNDELAIAQREGRLNRNFQGYTTTYDCDLLGLGVSSISAIGAAYSQNVKTLSEYYAAIDQHCHALERGVTLDRDDQIRGWVINQLMCNFRLDKTRFAAIFDCQFDRYFAAELSSLERFVSESLLRLTPDSIEVLPAARLLIRTLCMQFDAYRKNVTELRQFSRVI